MSLENQYQQTLKTKQCPSCGSFVDPSLTVCPKDGTSLVERFDKDPAFVNYEFMGTIGSGGMGVIYKARQVILNKLVAIKTLHPHLSSPAAFRRFQIEGQTTSLLKHPFIVSVHDFGMTKSGQTFMVMDFVDGETLDSLLRKIGQLDEEHFLNIFIDVCDALAHAHSRSIIHRDIKSSNIMIVKGDSGREEIRILDFGIAKLVSDTEGSASQVTRTGEIIGTATCMSPEQARGAKVDYRSDLYALGCVMYESLATSPPFVGNTPLETMLMHLEMKPLTIKEASMGHVVDPRIEKIIFCLLEKDPEHRYQSMIDLKHDLETLRNSKFGGAKPAEFRMPKKDVQIEKKSWRMPVIATVVSIVFLVSVGLGILFFKTEVANGVSSSYEPVDPRQDQREIKNGLESQLALQSPKVRVQSISGGGVGVEITNDDLAVFKGKHPTTRHVILLDALDVTDEGFKNLQDLRLTDLELRGSGATDLDWITSQTELRHLSIPSSKITPRGFQNIGKLKELRSLDISNTPFRDSDIKSIQGLVNLEQLDLNQSLVSDMGYDRLLNSFPHIVRINFSPLYLNKAGQPSTTEDRKRNDVLSYMTGSLSPVDARPPEVIFQDAQKAMAKSQWQKADVDLENVIFRLYWTLQGGKASLPKLTLLVSAESSKGDCLKKMNLPYAAIYMYNLASVHVQDNFLGAQFAGDMQQRVAGVFETLADDPTALKKAASFRSLAEDQFKTVGKIPQWAALRAKNLEIWQKDKVRLHE